ncbi:UNVERIFIED_CONTAM: hypothetical protein GTU68_036781 [Idotea baltica]|nr:hypothetical protein [Idotea baltica]
MDIIFIDGLKLESTIGVYEWEREVKQSLLVDIQLGWNIALAAKTDDLNQTLNYALVAERVHYFAGQSSFLLVEAFAEQLSNFLINEFNIPWLRLKVTKPNAVIEASGGVGVIIERTSC